MKTADFNYDLPIEYIAQTPIEPRDAAKLLVLDRKNQTLEHGIFRDIGNYLKPGDMLVLNQTRVIPARLYAHKIPTGGRVELLLLRCQDGQIWEVLAGGKGMGVGKILQVENGPKVQITGVLDGSCRQVRFEEPIEQYLAQAGHTPLPPYITVPLTDPERYQTVYAKEPGAVAAPTAGLHFTPDLIRRLEAKGIKFIKITLHVGLDTFAPVTEEDPNTHKIHTEWCEMPPSVAAEINETQQKGGRIIAVGTTSVRVLESAAKSAGRGEVVAPFCGYTDLYILPGFTFHAVDAMITNFHLPKSSLIILASAFAGRERILEAYQAAKKQGYRFYSFGDAMLIL
jgi:S-adenosylmethionine:tRNA ribosyltransferase-isomerase